jgi:hypothetical protein
VPDTRNSIREKGPLGTNTAKNTVDKPVATEEIKFNKDNKEGEAVVTTPLSS